MYTLKEHTETPIITIPSTEAPYKVYTVVSLFITEISF